MYMIRNPARLLVIRHMAASPNPCPPAHQLKNQRFDSLVPQQIDLNTLMEHPLVDYWTSLAIKGDAIASAVQ